MDLSAGLDYGGFHSGFIAVVGKPNVGKSTLVNALVQQKVAITSPLPQTTRHRIMGIKNGKGWQMVFVDTPGVRKPRSELDSFMERIYRQESYEADVILFMADASKPCDDEDGQAKRILKAITAGGKKLFLLLNKVDLVAAEAITACREKYNELASFMESFAVSALTGTGLEELEKVLLTHLPEGPCYFPEGTSTDQSMELFAAELTREKILLKTRQEVPHGVFVHTEEFREGKAAGSLYFRIIIYVEKESHKGIIIGKGGRLLKVIGTLARAELEKHTGKEVYLDLWVKIKEKWKDRRDLLRSWGYE
ncbi:MAG: GTPase Era [Candidatus Eremiobacteraeota bacterium]|nr:GTPase Era [Candidatus Eremiobacteraeota bacterium]